MTPWLLSAIVLTAALVPCGIVCARGPAMNRLAGLETAGSIEVLIFLVLAQAFGRPAFFDLALALAILAFAAGLVFARFFQRWL